MDEENFKRMSQEFAPNSSEHRHEWMKTEQTKDLNPNNYVDIQVEKKNDGLEIMVKNKDIHPEYKLCSIMFSANNNYNSFDLENKRLRRGSKNIWKKQGDTYIFILKWTSEVINTTIEVMSENRTLLNVEMDQTIILD